MLFIKLFDLKINNNHINKSGYDYHIMFTCSQLYTHARTIIITHRTYVLCYRLDIGHKYIDTCQLLIYYDELDF